MDSLDDARWTAVQERSEAADGVFFYAVITTGIFCRPVCSARRPLRKNVEFFATSAEAVVAGFRACRRCHPDRTRMTDPTIASVIAVCRWLEHPEDDADIRELASRVGWSQRHLRRIFKDVTGVTIAAYVRAQRADRVRAALRAGSPVTEAVFEAGYGSVRGLYEHGAPALPTRSHSSCPATGSFAATGRRAATAGAPNARRRSSLPKRGQLNRQRHDARCGLDRAPRVHE